MQFCFVFLWLLLKIQLLCFNFTKCLTLCFMGIYIYIYHIRLEYEKRVSMRRWNELNDIRQACVWFYSSFITLTRVDAAVCDVFGYIYCVKKTDIEAAQRAQVPFLFLRRDGFFFGLHFYQCPFFLFWGLVKGSSIVQFRTPRLLSVFNQIGNDSTRKAPDERCCHRFIIFFVEWGWTTSWFKTNPQVSSIFFAPDSTVPLHFPKKTSPHQKKGRKGWLCYIPNSTFSIRRTPCNSTPGKCASIYAFALKHQHPHAHHLRALDYCTNYPIDWLTDWLTWLTWLFDLACVRRSCW